MATFKLKIVQCNDGMMWYADKVGELVPYLRTFDDCYMSREPAGFSNIVKLEDADLVEVDDNNLIIA